MNRVEIITILGCIIIGLVAVFMPLKAEPSNCTVTCIDLGGGIVSCTSTCTDNV